MKPFLHERLFAALLLELSSGHYPEGSRFLSLRQMAARFGASKPTANLVLAKLLKEGLIETRPRSGAYVATGARQRAMLWLEKTPLSTIPTPKTWTAQRGKLLQKIGASPLRHIAIVYHASSRPDGGFLFENQIPSSLRCSQGCMKAARERGTDVSFALHDGSEERHHMIKEWLSQAEVGGVLIIQRAASFRQFHELVDPLLAKGIPVVNAFGDVQGADIINVDFNNVAGGFHAAMEMIHDGCKRITVISSRLASLQSSVLRVEGASLAAKQCGVEFRSVMATVENGTVHLPPLFETPSPREAIIGVTHDFAVAALRQARELGKTPEEMVCLAFSSVNETPWGERFHIAKMDFDAIGEAAIHALLDEMEGAEVHRSILIPLPVCRAG